MHTILGVKVYAATIGLENQSLVLTTISDQEQHMGN